MRLAIIDLGTNSVRFDVRQLGPGVRVRQLHREKIMIRLGQGVFVKGKLDRSAIQRTLHAFIRFKRLAETYRTTKIIAFGTSALREVSDRDKFLGLLKTKTGIEVRVISGSEEAQLIALGVLSKEKIGKERFALVDIGGGSTEISICRGKSVLHAHSFPLGTARLQQLYLEKSPPSATRLADLRHFIRATLSEVIRAEHWGKADRIIGSSGTIKALAKIIGGEGAQTIERAELTEIVDKMIGMTTTELLGLSGIEAKRVDMILAGAILFEEIMQFLNVKKARTTEYSLRDGILEEEIQLFMKGLSGETSHLALHLPDIQAKAKSFGAVPEHTDRVVKFAGELFDSLHSLHRLDSSWKTYLSAAVMLRDVGESINLAQHEVHAQYIVRNSDFAGADPWETEFIAELCRHHEGTKTPVLDSPQLKSKVRRDAYLQLLAILRVTDALDSGPESHLQLRSVRLPRGKVELAYAGRGLTGLEALQVEKRATFFAQVFKRELKASPQKKSRS